MQLSSILSLTSSLIPHRRVSSKKIEVIALHSHAYGSMIYLQTNLPHGDMIVRSADPGIRWLVWILAPPLTHVYSSVKQG